MSRMSVKKANINLKVTEDAPETIDDEEDPGKEALKRLEVGKKKKLYRNL